MLDDSKTRSDFSWLTDIEQIQAEIARDLERSQSPAPEHTDDEVGTSEWLEPTPEWRATPSPSPPVVLPPVSGFYRETIKGGTSRSWARTVAVIVLICTLGAGSLGFGLGAAYIWATSRSAEGITPAETVYNQEAPVITSNRYEFDIGSQQTGTVADMVQLLEPAVVSIATRFDSGSRATAAGSGIIFAENEDHIFIVTGLYVVHGGAQVTVRISGGQPLLARPVGSDSRIGLAVISVDKGQLVEAGIDSVVIATFGDSSQVQVGDVVFAIGNARNEGNSVTRGIISAGKQQIHLPDGSNFTVLQTDAAINYGNSGGPLINLSGEVIGINIDRATDRFGMAQIEGIGYSIVADLVVPRLNELISPSRPGLGIVARTLPDTVAAYYGIPAMGVLIIEVMAGGAAESAGIRPGDIITAFGGESVFDMDELLDAIAQRQIGDTVEVRVLRDGDLIVIDVELRAFIQENF